MARTSKILTLSLPPEMAKQVDEITKEEGRTRSELFREALRRYIEERKWATLYKYGELKAREKGTTEEDVENLVDARRR